MFQGKRRKAPKRLQGYTGPYPYFMLNEARKKLMQFVDTKETVIWSRIRSKTGIYENGDRSTELGWGESSTYYSHADLEEENTVEGDLRSQIRSTGNPATTSPSATITSADVSTDYLNESELFVESPNQVNSSAYELSQKEESQSSSNEIKLNEELNVDQNLDSQKPNSSNKDKEISAAIIRRPESPEEGEIIEIDEDFPEEIVEISDDTSTEIEITKKEMINNETVIIVLDDNESKIASGSKLSGSSFQSKHVQLQPAVASKSDEGLEEDCIVITVGSDEDKGMSSRGNQIKKHMGIDDCPLPSYDDKSTSNEKCLQDSLEEISNNVPVTNEDLSVVPVYKCDFCDQICETLSVMHTHLNTSGHFSGSRVSLCKENGSYSILEKLAIMKKENLFKTVVAICPFQPCNQIFQTIYACALHHRIKHDHLGDLVYGVADVLQTDNTPNPCFSLACPVCSLDCRCLKTVERQKPQKGHDKWFNRLPVHFQKYHWPFNYKTGDCHFICPDCYKAFKFLSSALRHQVSHQGSTVSHDMELIVMQTGEIKVLKLPESNAEKKNTLLTINKEQEQLAGSSGNNSFTKNAHLDTNGGELFYIDRRPMLPYSDNPGAANSSDGKGQSTGDTKFHSEQLDQDVSISKEVISSDILETQEAISGTSKDQVNGYMFCCDYCNTLDVNRLSVYQHLVNESHFTASTVQVDKNNQSIALFKQKTLFNYRGAYKTRVAACPIEGCAEIFSDIFQCNVHVNVFHPFSENIYGIAKIKKSTVDELSLNLACETCKSSFMNRRMLNQHLKHSNHIPPNHKNEDSSVNIHWICVYCETIFNSYFTAIAHILKEHVLNSINDLYKIKVVLVDKNVSKVNMLPCASDRAGEFRNIETKRAAMNKLKKGKGKMVRKRIEGERKKLRNIGNRSGGKRKMNKKE